MESTQPIRDNAVKQELISRLQLKFRLLKGWKITYGDDGGGYRGQCVKNTRDCIGNIYPWSDTEEPPKDYFLHELMHMAIAAMQLDNKCIPYGIRRENEEIFVQDLCVLIFGEEHDNDSFDERRHEGSH